jgi:hypothetical protein
MTIEQSAIGVVAAEMMEELENAYGEDAQIERVALVVSVEVGDENTVHFKFSTGSTVYMAKGLLAHVHDNLGK